MKNDCALFYPSDYRLVEVVAGGELDGCGTCARDSLVARHARLTLISELGSLDRSCHRPVREVGHACRLRKDVLRV